MRTLVIDSRVGGMGDIWMRLLALYSLAALKPECRLEITIPPSLAGLGAQLFSDRLGVVTEPSAGAVTLTHLGLRHTVPAMLRGRKFIYPFFRLNEKDRKVKTVKARMNAGLIELVALTGRVALPLAQRQEDYQGFMELTALPMFKPVTPEAFGAQARQDLPLVRARLRRNFPPRPEQPLAVFPSGSAHQGMPVAWAKEHFPSALFVFFMKDTYREDFRAAGLATVTFDSVASLLHTAAGAHRLLSTESFTSHILQTYAGDVVIALTQQLGSRIVHPAFDGPAVLSRAACCPCRSLDRGHHPQCETGHDYCVTWNDPDYVRTIQEALR